LAKKLSEPKENILTYTNISKLSNSLYVNLAQTADLILPTEAEIAVIPYTLPMA